MKNWLFAIKQFFLKLLTASRTLGSFTAFASWTKLCSFSAKVLSNSLISFEVIPANKIIEEKISEFMKLSFWKNLF